MRVRVRTLGWALSLAVLVLSAAAVPDIRSAPKGGGVCRRSGKRGVVVLLARAPGHRAILFVAPNGELKVATKGRVDPCGGTLAEIRSVRGDGSRQRDTLTLDRSRGLEGARLRFLISLGGGRDSLRLLGDRNTDRMRFSEFESSSPWIQVFSWRRVGRGNTFNVERLILQGKGGADRIIGKPANPSRFTRSISIRMITKGGTRPDRVIGGRKRDVLEGEGGKDYLRGGKGPDVLAGGGGTDDCSGGPAIDSVLGCEIQP